MHHPPAHLILVLRLASDTFYSTYCYCVFRFPSPPNLSSSVTAHHSVTSEHHSPIISYLPLVIPFFFSTPSSFHFLGRLHSITASSFPWSIFLTVYIATLLVKQSTSSFSLPLCTCVTSSVDFSRLVFRFFFHFFPPPLFRQNYLHTVYVPSSSLRPLYSISSQNFFFSYKLHGQ